MPRENGAFFMSQIIVEFKGIFGVNLRSMNLPDTLKFFTGFFDYFKKLTPSEKINFLLMGVIFFSWGLLYLNDKRHCENTIILSHRVERGDSLRTKDQFEYNKNLEHYTDKFVRFSEIILEQNKKIEQIKQEP